MALNTLDSLYLSAAEQRAVQSWSNTYDSAMARGDVAAAEMAHKEVEAIRARYGFTGGDDGIKVSPLSNRASTTTMPFTPVSSAKDAAATTLSISGNNTADIIPADFARTTKIIFAVFAVIAVAVGMSK